MLEFGGGMQRFRIKEDNITAKAKCDFCGVIKLKQHMIKEQSVLLKCCVCALSDLKRAEKCGKISIK